jgi:hypothetical protein
MFHEIAASGPLWTSAFWLSATQRNLAKRLVKVSDRLLTSKQLYAEILQGYSKGRFNEIPSLPIFSSVGEPTNPPDLSKRDRHLVIFGGQGQRSKVYQFLGKFGTFVIYRAQQIQLFLDMNNNHGICTDCP